jgi:peptidoglycan biosynthesis protein MviN/MurJ (putative lipid II flippase)
LPGTVAFTVSKLLQADLAARDKLQQCVNAQFMVLAVMLMLDAALVPDYGAVGAAAASTVAYVVATIYTLWVYSRETGTSSWKCLFVHAEDFRYVGDVFRSVMKKIRRGKL